MMEFLETRQVHANTARLTVVELKQLFDDYSEVDDVYSSSDCNFEKLTLDRFQKFVDDFYDPTLNKARYELVRELSYELKYTKMDIAKQKAQSCFASASNKINQLLTKVGQE